jgi:hypothetical protein
MVKVPLKTYTPPPEAEEDDEYVLPVIFDPGFISRAAALSTYTREAVLSVRPQRVIWSRTSLTPEETLKRGPGTFRLTAVSGVFALQGQGNAACPVKRRGRTGTASPQGPGGKGFIRAQKDGIGRIVGGVGL